MDIQENGWKGIDCVDVSQGEGHVEGCCACGNELSSSIKFGEFLDYLRTSESFSRRTLLSGVSN